jgi:ABC-2 type transport system permease protein
MKTLLWLIRREWWEHRGSLFWAPLIAGGVFLALNLLALTAGLFHLHQSGGLGALQAHVTGVDLSQAGGVLDAILLGAVGGVFLIMAITVFFYALGALYDDRRDRSVLFWKSLPVSDAQTVASKALMALVVAPLVALAIGLAVGLVLMAVLALVLQVHGVSAGPWLFLIHPVSLLGVLVGLWPLYLLGTLPTIGWLLLCSAWCRSRPFLWAVLLPIGAVVLAHWFGWMGLPVAGVGTLFQWLLAGTVPWPPLLGVRRLVGSDPAVPMDVLSDLWHQALGTPTLWWGAGLGLVFLGGAVLARRRSIGAL